MSQNREVIFEHLGLMDYAQAWEYQEKLFTKTLALKVQNREAEPQNRVATPNHLLFCQHPHVFTLGKSGSETNLLADEEELRRREATYYKVNRGGDITYHGPGQIVGYPIFDLDNFFTDIHLYLRTLEEAIIKTLAEYGIAAGRYPGYTGVWLDADDDQKARKICAMGVKASRWVTMHGFAFNINTDLAYFDLIVPCGIKDKAVTSLEQELGRPVPLPEVEEKLLSHLLQAFGATRAATPAYEGTH